VLIHSGILLLNISTLTFLVFCGCQPQDDGDYGQDDGCNLDWDGAASEAPAPPSATCVWNQAYQENYDHDSVGEVLARAEGCYVLVDPFDCTVARDVISQMQQAGNSVGCYISVGTCEDWRDDFRELRSAGACSSREWPQWKGEFFIVDVDAAIPVMRARVEQAADWGCDYVEFDNMDWAVDPEEYNLPITTEQGAAYYNAICDSVHELGMWCMAKSTRADASQFDGLTVDSSPDDLAWWEQGHLASTLEAGQLGIIVHYGEDDCAAAASNYREDYGDELSFFCESRDEKRYLH
jgi:hypothetical protein